MLKNNLAEKEREGVLVKFFWCNNVKFEMGIKRLLFKNRQNEYKIVSLNCIVIHFNNFFYFRTSLVSLNSSL